MSISLREVEKDYSKGTGALPERGEDGKGRG